MNIERSRNYSSKYQTLILSITLFSLLAAGVMFVTYAISEQLARKAKIINTAFEQTSLINQTISDVYIINGQFRSGEAYTFALNRLQQTIELIDGRVNVYLNGGELKIDQHPLGKIIQYKPPQDERFIQLIEDISVTWDEYKKRIEPVFRIDENVTINIQKPFQFYGAIVFTPGAISGLNRLQLQRKMDNFADYLQLRSNKFLSKLRLLQLIGIALTLTALLFILLFVIRQLRKGDIQLENAHNETMGILSTIQEGLFLINQDKKIGTEHSIELEEILETKDISGRYFIELISTLVSDQALKNTETFINSIFNPKVVEDLITTLNPLKEVKATIKSASGKTIEKHLSFNFFRVTKDTNIQNILVSVKDITARILLQEKNENTKNTNHQTLQVFHAITNTNHKTLDIFLKRGLSDLNNVNQTLKEHIKDTSDYQNKINHISIIIHKIKGESSSLELEDFSNHLHEFENQLTGVRNTLNMDGMDFIPLIVQLKDLILYTESLIELSTRISNLKLNDKDTGVEEIDEANIPDWSHLNKLVDNLCINYDKKVSLITSGLFDTNLSDKQFHTVNTVLIHLIKNSFVHGIETAEERIKQKKKKSGRIDIRLNQLSNGSLELIYQDDGRGFNYQYISRLIGEHSGIDKEVLSKWKNEDIVRYIFTQPLSTSPLDINAGRGIGLNVILHSVQEAGGHLNLSQRKGKYCQYTLTLPAA